MFSPSAVTFCGRMASRRRREMKMIFPLRMICELDEFYSDLSD